MTRKVRYPTPRWSTSTTRSSGSQFRSQVRQNTLPGPSRPLRVLTGRTNRTRTLLRAGAWFARFHGEKIPSAIERYADEITRVIGVLELVLARNGTGWLVGEDCTYANLAFVTWNKVGEGLLEERGVPSAGLEAKFPKCAAWTRALGEREEVRRVGELMARGRAEHGLYVEGEMSRSIFLPLPAIARLTAFSESQTQSASSFSVHSHSLSPSPSTSLLSLDFLWPTLPTGS